MIGLARAVGRSLHGKILVRTRFWLRQHLTLTSYIYQGLVGTRNFAQDLKVTFILICYRPCFFISIFNPKTAGCQTGDSDDSR